jgi:hypothetical protein
MSKCEFAEFLASFNIKDDRQYTVNEVAAIMGTTAKNVKFWRLVGISNKVGGTVVLESFDKGGVPTVLGRHLKEFIMRRNGVKPEKPS